MKKKKRDLLSPTSKCCLKKYLDMDLISKYGSLLSILSIFLFCFAIQVHLVQWVKTYGAKNRCNHQDGWNNTV